MSNDEDDNDDLKIDKPSFSINEATDLKVYTKNRLNYLEIYTYEYLIQLVSKIKSSNKFINDINEETITNC